MLTGDACPFVGRLRERRLLGELVTASEGAGSAALIIGEPGIGKTALLEQIAATAGPARVLWVRGVESEAVLAFSAVSDLLLPLRDFFDQLPSVQREALEVSLAVTPGQITNPLAGCAAALGVLAAAGEVQPLVVIVDDFQWIDPSSQQILLFVARRLTSERVAMLISVRDEVAHPVVKSPIMKMGIPTLRLDGLSTDECRALVAGLRVELSSTMLRKIVSSTGGNPLAVIETVSAAPTEVLRGSGADFDVASIGSALEQVWASALDRLPDSTRLALLVIAASRESDPATLTPVLASLEVSLQDLAPAERAGLVRTSASELTLRHPLLRTVILARTPLDTRLRVYQHLAEYSSGHLRAWYLAASITGRDDAIADSLAAAALVDRNRSGFQSSARTWERAAGLTTDPNCRAERLLAAATDAHLAGESELAVTWCTEALDLRSDPRFSADVEVVRGRATAWLGHPVRAASDLVRAADAVLATDTDRAARLYAEAALPYAMANRPREMLDVARRSEAAVPPGQPSLQSTAVTAVALVLAGMSTDARDHLKIAERISANVESAWDLQFLTMLGVIRVSLEDFAAARDLTGSILRAARRTGVASVVAFVLGACSELEWWTGQWAAGYAYAAESLHWAEELRQAGSVGYALAALARIDAARGDVALCRQRVQQANRDSLPYGIECLEVYLPAALGLAALGSGDLDAATAQLDQARVAAAEGGMAATNVVPYGGDLVEAHVRAGNYECAEEALAWLSERATETGLAYPAAAAARCRGLLSRDADVAQACFAEAMTLLERQHMPFELGRTMLCHAETLRRLRRPAAARPLLRRALRVFDHLGARPWAARAEAELAAAGARRPIDRELDRPRLNLLTPQEFQVAKAVADGLNNPETAAALFVSRKTVEAHLTRVYRKLMVRSRADLARLFAQSPPL